MKRARFVLFCLALAACVPRGEITYEPDVALVGTRQEIFVATSRAIDPKTGEFGAGRVMDDNYARYVVQIPPDRALGSINWPKRGGQVDASHDFVTVDQQFYGGPSKGGRREGGRAEFRDGLAAALLKMPAGRREVRIFAHGFNTNFAEGLYRLAQLDHDLGFPGVSVHYSWPSRGKPLAYLVDRESAVYSRDGFETLLMTVADAGAERIVIVGHSMGALLAMEGLRQVAISRNERVLKRIGGIVLMSPDIDVDVFKKGARRIGKLPQPFYIFTSQKDKALALSSRLSGRPDRLGNLESPAEVADLDVTLIDVSAFSEKSGHFTVGDSPALISILGRMAEVEAAMNSASGPSLGLLGGTIVNFSHATSVVAGPPPGSKPGERN